MDSPAMMAGIKQGDVLVGMNDRFIQSFSEYATQLLQMDVGETAHVTVMRQAQNEYKEMTFDIVLEEASKH
jgi:S1-C subfamily serine protease